MSEHCGYVVAVKTIRKHNNADRLQVATFFGNDTIVGLNTKLGDVGIYFPSDLQLSEAYCKANHLLREKVERKNVGGYLDPNKRNIQAIRLRGEHSDGLFMPLDSLKFTGGDYQSLSLGDKIDIFNGQEICCKYIPAVKIKNSGSSQLNVVKKKKFAIAPLFTEHVDTEQLAYNLSQFKSGDQIEITLKIHGTSQRTGYLPKFQKYASQGFLIDKIIQLLLNPKVKLMNRLASIETINQWINKHQIPVYEYGYVTGTRRTVIDDTWTNTGFYGENEFRKQHADKLEGKLLKGETVYYEVAGFTTSGASIMGSVSNNKIQDKSFIKQYGKTTVFSYGCAPCESHMFVYRMTLTTEGGVVIEYTPDQMRMRCEQIGVDCVPVFYKGFIPDNIQNPGEWVQQLAEQFYDGVDPIGKTHVREGVVIRIINRPKFTAFKHKNFSFKVLEGIVKDTAQVPDMEEAQEIL